MGGEGEISQGPSAETAAPTARAPSVAQANASSGAENLDTLEQKVKDLRDAEDDAKESAEEPSTTEPANAKEKGLDQTQETQTNTLTQPEQNLTPETEAVPAQEPPEVPRKLAGDSEYIRIVGERYHALKQQGGEINRAKIDQVTRESLSEYYNNWAKTEVEKGLSNTVKSDSLYQQKLGEAVTNAQDRGEALDAKKLSEEALAKYRQEEDLRAEKAAEPQTEQKTTDQQTEDVQKKLSELLENNGEKLTGTVTIEAKDLALVLKALADAREPDQKRKESKLMLLIKLLGLLTLSVVTETGKMATGQQGR